MTRRLVLATTNAAKVAELQELLDASGVAVEVVARPADLVVVEDAPDFVGNARRKAVAVAAATGEWSLADDSGLEVDALGGAPGVRSARFSGPDATDRSNVELLLVRLDAAGARAPADRVGWFRCAIVVAPPPGSEPSEAELVAEGSVQGRILEQPRGTGGFGYDPVFVPDEGDGRTFAEMTSSEKHQLSHRGRALRALLPGLAEVI
ncbi:MAG: RdgB/HAM1 family non-canonical purine NTP pyrophosphatase [Actinobacteria bacterium]|nr:RdgB/HAM1 family non-canonical purine NTP pyrophosphatase [Actinomycetota bacterium]